MLKVTTRRLVGYMFHVILSSYLQSWGMYTSNRANRLCYSR
jgi:hypothetical protein